MKRASLRQLAGIAVVLAVAGVAALTASPEALFAHAERLAERPALFAAVLLCVYLVRPLLAWPISALSILLGYVLGPVAVPVALAGAVVTALPAYGTARYLGHDAGLLARVGDAGGVVRRTTGDLRGVVAVRLAPLPTDPVSYAAGLAEVPLRPYVAGTALGEAPWVVAGVLLGASAGELTAAGTAADPLLVVTAAALAALLALSGPAYRRVAGELDEV
ncbi:TVP38/TMEM64 family protein [Natronomonas marina]|uniref:TVP38/TMEM64 family protein n=1 Tax=Natronomonas marina TaxID=2961939 RepID=UPI0020C947EA|nr:VTT domain-containing protein [Natronomonas marina]